MLHNAYVRLNYHFDRYIGDFVIPLITNTKNIECIGLDDRQVIFR